VQDPEKYARTDALDDVQGERDVRGLPLDRVGVRNLRMPATVAGQSTIACASIAVMLPAEARGTHMSRLVEAFDAHRHDLRQETLPALLEDLRSRLGAPAAEVDLSFPLFFDRAAPVSRATAPLEVDAGLFGRSVDGVLEVRTTVGALVTSLCPCSKEISDYGAHNQRGRVRLEVTPRNREGHLAPLPFGELLAVAERHASSPVFPVLKRPDERHVTMHAYDHPVLVEDLVRGIASELREDPRVAAFRVECVNEESIHAHDAFAEIRWVRP